MKSLPGFKEVMPTYDEVIKLTKAIDEEEKVKRMAKVKIEAIKRIVNAELGEELIVISLPVGKLTRDNLEKLEAVVKEIKNNSLH